MALAGRFQRSGLSGSHRNRQSQLVLADLRKKTNRAIDFRNGSSRGFDIRDRQHYVYTRIRSGGTREKECGTQVAGDCRYGRFLFELIFPDDPITATIAPSHMSTSGRLWTASVSRSSMMVSRSSFGSFALSPDGSSLVTTLPVPDVPPSWETLCTRRLSHLTRTVFAPDITTRNRPCASVCPDRSANRLSPILNGRTGQQMTLDAGRLGGPGWSSDGQKSYCRAHSSNPKTNGRPVPASLLWIYPPTHFRLCGDVEGRYETECRRRLPPIYGRSVCRRRPQRVMVSFYQSMRPVTQNHRIPTQQTVRGKCRARLRKTRSAEHRP